MEPSGPNQSPPGSPMHRQSLGRRLAWLRLTHLGAFASHRILSVGSEALLEEKGVKAIGGFRVNPLAYVIEQMINSRCSKLSCPLPCFIDGLLRNDLDISVKHIVPPPNRFRPVGVQNLSGEWSLRIDPIDSCRHVFIALVNRRMAWIAIDAFPHFGMEQVNIVVGQ